MVPKIMAVLPHGAWGRFLGQKNGAGAVLLTPSHFSPSALSKYTFASYPLDHLCKTFHIRNHGKQPDSNIPACLI
jgi:hypothetical protein